jgi:SAM-dependent methyltransferase
MNPFESDAQRYDEWFSKHAAVYQSEVNALREVIRPFSPGSRRVEIGTGTGRFSTPFGITEGVEPAAAMREIAKARGIRVVEGVGEKLPFDSDLYDLALLVTTICFVDDPLQCLREVSRVLKPGGQLIVGFVDRESSLGQHYERRVAESVFYRNARFFSVLDVDEMIARAGFVELQYRQTLFRTLAEIKTPEPVKIGYGEGGFVVVSARKPPGR